jgi:KaiC/GvpD/RAD55 family RecA-like ATPase
MKRVRTGIKGLDRLIAGGIPEGSSVLLTGACGTGKSILSLQYVYNGALEGEPGVYVTFEESREKVVEHAAEFGWDIPGLEEKGLLTVYTVETDDLGEVLIDVKAKVESMGAKRLVIDSLTTMMEHGIIYRSRISKDMSRLGASDERIRFPTEGHDVSRKDIYFIVGRINRMGTTSLLISEVGEKSSYLSRDTVSEFACDGVILLEISTVGGSPERLLTVKKLRGTPVNLSMSTLKFGPAGIEVED